MQSEGKYGMLIDSAYESIIIAQDGLFKLVNPAAVSLFELSSKEEIVGREFPEFIHPDDRNMVVNNYQRRIAKKSVPDRYHFRVIGHRGNVKWVEINGTCIEWQGNPATLNFLTDITEQKQAEEKLFHSKYTLAEAERIGNTGNWDYNFATDTSEWSDNMYRILDVEKGTPIGDAFNYLIENVIHPDDRDRIIATYFNPLPGKHAYNDECRIIRKDGSIRHIQILAEIILDENENPLSIIGIAKDITERKESEAAINNALKELKKSQRIAQLGNWKLDLTTNIFTASEEALRLFGFPVDSHPEFKDISECIYAEDHELSMNTLKNALQTGESYSIELRIVRKDNGDIRNIQSIGEVQFDNQQKPIAIFGTNQDITERKLAEYKVLQTRQNYEAFFNTIDEFLFVLDEQGNIIYTNNTVIDRLGYTQRELEGQSILMIHPPEFRKEAEKIIFEMLGGKTEFCPVPIITKSGIQIPVETRVNHGIWDNKPVIFGVTKDISEVKFSEEKFSKVFYLNPSACGLTDLLTGEYIEVNDAFYKLLGFNKNEVIGRTPVELGIFTKEGQDALLLKIRENSQTNNVEATLTAKNGDIKNVILASENIRVQDKIYRYTVVHDMTEQRIAELLRNQQLFFTTALNKIAEIIIANENPDYILDSTNRIIGETLQADRVLIYDISFDKNSITGLCEWLRIEHPDIESRLGRYNSMDMFRTSFAEIMNTHKYLESHFNSVNKYFTVNGADQILHKDLNIKSLLWYPFAFNEHGYYLFTINHILEQRNWAQEEIDFLESVANLVNLALMKIRFINERQQAEKMLIESKESSLINQMKPHFIFNTLTAILSYIYSNSPREANQYISSFASLMRIYLTNSQNEFITIKEEITGIKYYLELQKLRYYDKFDYSVSYDNNEEFASMNIPPMLTQPLVENAIEHGIQNKRSKGNINISFSLSDQYILITVEDDGPGVEFTKNLKKTDKHLSASTSIIKERLKWLNKKYSQKITYEISDIYKDGEIAGTLAKMLIPFTI